MKLRFNPNGLSKEEADKLVRNNKRYFYVTLIWLLLTNLVAVLGFSVMKAMDYPALMLEASVVIVCFHSLYVIAIAFLIMMHSKQIIEAQNKENQRGAPSESTE